MNAVQYYAPKSVQEAVKLLDKYGAQGTIVAGGTDVVTGMHDGKIKPEVIIYIGNLGLDSIEVRDDQIVLGGLTKIADVADSSVLKKSLPLLPMAASVLGNPMTRNKATVAGNLVGASPAADIASALLSLDGVVTLVSVNGERKVALADFFEGYRKIAKKPNELLTEISIPIKDVKGTFIKFGRRKAATLSVVNVSCTLAIDKKGKCEDARIVLGAMAPTTMRATKAEALLKGKKITNDLIGKAADAAVAQAQPIDDGRATAWYRRKLAYALVARALQQSMGGDEK